MFGNKNIPIRRDPDKINTHDFARFDLSCLFSTSPVDVDALNTVASLLTFNE
ncbi:hypothetical protein [Mycoplasmopsis bovis]|uniref:hypothetical protein n=1 Tax=Mycoplasmopsis bovis TaxID=28903 RepID=UPI002105968B|nr:hypothetical protein [Mycoplasmopsis bovis]UTW26374.1 hypothetical protein L8F43_01285 [Mycoplasmopsis bovis]